nr:MAG TPA: hypothetical protein [Caudoviricetes sp.]
MKSKRDEATTKRNEKRRVRRGVPQKRRKAPGRRARHSEPKTWHSGTLAHGREAC